MPVYLQPTFTRSVLDKTLEEMDSLDNDGFGHLRGRCVIASICGVVETICHATATAFTSLAVALTVGQWQRALNATQHYAKMTAGAAVATAIAATGSFRPQHAQAKILSIHGEHKTKLEPEPEPESPLFEPEPEPEPIPEPKPEPVPVPAAAPEPEPESAPPPPPPEPRIVSIEGQLAVATYAWLKDLQAQLDPIEWTVTCRELGAELPRSQVSKAIKKLLKQAKQEVDKETHVVAARKNPRERYKELILSLPSRAEGIVARLLPTLLGNWAYGRFHDQLEARHDEAQHKWGERFEKEQFADSRRTIDVEFVDQLDDVAADRSLTKEELAHAVIALGNRFAGRIKDIPVHHPSLGERIYGATVGRVLGSN